MKRLLTCAFVTLTLFGCSQSGTVHSVPADEARSLLPNRNWLDKMPADSKERWSLFRFIPQMNSSGMYQERSLYAGSFELFAYEATGDEIRFNMLHTGQKQTVHYRIDALRPGEHGPFDLRLQLDQSPLGPATYYGFRNEPRGAQQGDLDQSLQHMLRR